VKFYLLFWTDFDLNGKFSVDFDKADHPTTFGRTKYLLCTLCPMSRIVLSFLARVICLVLFSLNFNSYFQRQKRIPDGCLASTDNVDIIGVTKYLCLLVEYSPFVCSFARRTIDLSTRLKISGDNMSPCLSPYRLSKYLEQSF
jgi:hypothetical protein